jgi:hypothetical protein
MKRTILILALLTTAAAMGQSLQDQRACYVQAHKVASKGAHVTNHFDARTKTCWVREFSNTNGAIDVSVYNAFEPNISEAEFAGNTSGPNQPSLQAVICFVHETKCSNKLDFDRLAKQRYGF